jgi:hypothetical protein
MSSVVASIDSSQGNAVVELDGRHFRKVKKRRLLPIDSLFLQQRVDAAIETCRGLARVARALQQRRCVARVELEGLVEGRELFGAAIQPVERAGKREPQRGARRNWS